jgi:hydroxyacylglutathione hydrolase
MLSLEDVGAFSSEVTRSMPARPPTVERVVALNLSGAAHPGPVPLLDPDGLARLLDDGACALDIREPESFDSAHLDGSVNLPASGHALSTRAAWAAGDEDIVVVSDSLESGHAAVELLRAGGVWSVAGLALADPAGWRTAGLAVRSCGVMSPDGVARGIGSSAVTLVDVRDRAEWSEGHVAGARNLPLSELGDGRNVSFPAETSIGVVCASGIRAAIAASILRRRGHERVLRVGAGVDELARLGAPIVRERG